MLSSPFPEAAEAGALPGGAGAAAGGEGRRVWPLAGAAGEEAGGGPAEHQGVSAAGVHQGGCRGPRPESGAAPGLRETGTLWNLEGEGRDGLKMGPLFSVCGGDGARVRLAVCLCASVLHL